MFEAFITGISVVCIVVCLATVRQANRTMRHVHKNAPIRSGQKMPVQNVKSEDGRLIGRVDIMNDASDYRRLEKVLQPLLEESGRSESSIDKNSDWISLLDAGWATDYLRILDSCSNAASNTGDVSQSRELLSTLIAALDSVLNRCDTSMAEPETYQRILALSILTRRALYKLSPCRHESIDDASNSLFSKRRLLSERLINQLDEMASVSMDDSVQYALVNAKKGE